MFEKIKTRYKEWEKKVEARDIEKCKQHPTLWKLGFRLYILFLIGLIVLWLTSTTSIINILFSSLIIVPVFSYIIWTIRTGFLNVYNKANPNNPIKYF